MSQFSHVCGLKFTLLNTSSILDFLRINKTFLDFLRMYHLLSKEYWKQNPSNFPGNIKSSPWSLVVKSLRESLATHILTSTYYQMMNEERGKNIFIRFFKYSPTLQSCSCTSKYYPRSQFALNIEICVCDGHLYKYLQCT